MISIGVFATRHVQKWQQLTGVARSDILNEFRSVRLTKLDQHVNEMMTTPGKMFQKF